MAGVGDKLLLILPRPHHGTGDEAAQQPTDAQQHQQRRAADQQADPHQRPEGGLLKGAVHKSDADGQGAVLPVKAHVPGCQHAALAAVGQRLGDGGQQRVLVVQIVVAAAGDADGAAGQHLRQKAGKPGVGHAGLHRLLQLIGIAVSNVGPGEEVHPGEHRQQHQGGHRHDNAGDLPAQLPDHDAASSSWVRQ